MNWRDENNGMSVAQRAAGMVATWLHGPDTRLHLCEICTELAEVCIAAADVAVGKLDAAMYAAIDAQKAAEARAEVLLAALREIDQRGPINRPNGPLAFMQERELGHALARWDAAVIARAAIAQAEGGAR